MSRRLTNNKIRVRTRAVISSNSSSTKTKDRWTRGRNRFRCRIPKAKQFSRQISIKFRKTNNNWLPKLIKFNRKQCKTTKIKCSTISWTCSRTSHSRWVTMLYLSIRQRPRRRWPRLRSQMLKRKLRRLRLHKKSPVHMPPMCMQPPMQLISRLKLNLCMHNWLNSKTKFK